MGKPGNCQRCAGRGEIPGDYHRDDRDCTACNATGWTTDRHIARAEESILATLRLDHDDAIDDVQRAEVLAALTTLAGAVRDDEAQAQDEHRGIARRHGVGT